MRLTRRSLLLGAGLAGLGGVLSGCGGGASGAAPDTGALRFWYWSGGLSDAVVTSVTRSFADRRTIRPTQVSGDFKQRLSTTLSTRHLVPDISGVKGEDMPLFLDRADDFIDLNTLGARSVQGSFVAAKYAAATAADGRQIGLPIDLGPTALFLREDLWARAGLSTDIATVSAQMTDWDGWFAAAARLKDALPGTFAVRNSTDVFGVALAQQSETFLTRSGDFIGDGGGVRHAWDLAVRAITEGLQAGIYDDDTFNAALTAGSLTGHLGPAWNGLDIASGAPGTSGAWRVAACPGGPANIGGSFLTLPSTCRDPKLAFSFITELLSPANEGKGFDDASIFPAVPAAYALPALTRGQDFYGGQVTIEVFGPAAEHLPLVYDDARNAAAVVSYLTELSNVEGGKDPAAAWQDAVTQAAATVKGTA